MAAAVRQDASFSRSRSGRMVPATGSSRKDSSVAGGTPETAGSLPGRHVSEILLVLIADKFEKIRPQLQIILLDGCRPGLGVRLRIVDRHLNIEFSERWAAKALDDV